LLNAALNHLELFNHGMGFSLSDLIGNSGGDQKDSAQQKKDNSDNCYEPFLHTLRFLYCWFGFDTTTSSETALGVPSGLVG